ncbi:hypothetical protein E4U41_000876 [Claviceps citrina]|nr:hypothetical protein E4U41_000876 [Claviceps citrina]
MAALDESGHLRDSDDAKSAVDTCSLFELAAKHAVHDAASATVNRRFTIQELDWFRRNSYNLGVLTSSEWQPLHTARIINTCLAFTTCYPADVALSQTMATELALTALRCHFIIAASLHKQAQSDDASGRLQHYQALRHHVAEYGSTLRSAERLSSDAHTQHDFHIKYTTLLVWDFESAIHLSQFTDLIPIVQLQKPLGNVEAYKAMGDVLLQSSPPPPEILLSTLKRIINEIHALEEFDAAKLAKYLRCLFHVLVPMEDDTLALGVLDHFTQVTLESKAVMAMPETAIPAVELEWFVATAFNHALDHYVQFREEQCRVWGSKAMELAGLMPDGGVLARTLQARFGHLRFSESHGFLSTG